MNYEVAYLSHSGNTAILAQEIARLLSDEAVHLTDLSRGEPSQNADVYLVGFGVNRGRVPVKIMDVLESAEGKTILLFVTCGMEPTEAYKASVERKILPFLPDQCNYRGIFLCAGEFPDEVVRNLPELLRQQPDNPQAQLLAQHHQKTSGHPNAEDLAHLQTFLRAKLKK
jgi:flavodoxin